MCVYVCVCVCMWVHPCVSCEYLCLQKIMYAVLLGGSTQRAEGFLSGAMLVPCTFHVVLPRQRLFVHFKTAIL